MVRSLKISHVGAAHQYAPQEQYNNFHDGDTDEEIEMEPAPVVILTLSWCLMMRRTQKR
jgi:hypothetical protein